MKIKMTRTIVLAAVATLGGAAAHAETQVAAAEVTFPFQAAGVEYQPGTYRLSEYPMPDIFTLEDAGSGHKKFVSTTAPGNQSNDRNARLVFQCSEERGCVLSKIVLSDGRRWQVRAPRLKRSEFARTETVRLGNSLAE